MQGLRFSVGIWPGGKVDSSSLPVGASPDRRRYCLKRQGFVAGRPDKAHLRPQTKRGARDLYWQIV